MPSRLLSILAAGALALGAALPTQAAQTHVAVAANFTDAAKEIAARSRRRPATRRSSASARPASSTPRSPRTRRSRSFWRPTRRGRKRRWTTGSACRAASSPTRPARSCSGAGTPDLVKGAETLKARQVRQDRHRQPGDGALWRGRGRGDAGARRLRRARAEDRAGQQHRPDLPVRGRPAMPSSASSRCRRSRARTTARAGSCPAISTTPIAQDAVLLKTGRGQRGRQGFHRLPEGPGGRPRSCEKYGYGAGG